MPVSQMPAGFGINSVEAAAAATAFPPSPTRLCNYPEVILHVSPNQTLI